MLRLTQSHRSDLNRRPMLYESVGRESSPRDNSLTAADVVESGDSPNCSTGPKLAPRIDEVADTGTLNAETIGVEPVSHDDADELPAWLADAVRRWREWPEWKRAAVRALVEANDGNR
jgi:hypothetical protein